VKELGIPKNFFCFLLLISAHQLNMQYFEEYIEEYFEHEDRLWTREVAVPRLLRVVQVLSLVTSPLEADAYSGIKTDAGSSSRSPVDSWLLRESRLIRI